MASTLDSDATFISSSRITQPVESSSSIIFQLPKPEITTTKANTQNQSTSSSSKSDTITHCELDINTPAALPLIKESSPTPQASTPDKSKLDKPSFFPLSTLQIQTLSEIIAEQNLEGKRKRSMTHFNGIPLSILSPPTSSEKASSASAPRRIITPKKIRDLGDLFSRTTLGDDQNKDKRSENPQKSTISIIIPRNERRERERERGQHSIKPQMQTNASSTERSSYSDSYSSSSSVSAGSSGRNSRSYTYVETEGSADEYVHIEKTYNTRNEAFQSSEGEESEEDEDTYDSDSDSEDDLVFIMTP
ncbi:uncharacterized protein I303_103444 [Kwoniella dejecticola CBS 10117]|uniref:Uncharacterized protein n=1 Tax=Kwoniella dejecticola CBS 10117 TaxID=1296121 RepID=A0A1A6A6S4_9TREE|nr:uncharacterized protein I303_03467 [Kwoniella dejecticola CBS 10117]OBR85755.1 hypothetical protein I303_03467 [Kwoniella dejecticola CBS 10117]